MIALVSGSNALAFFVGLNWDRVLFWLLSQVH